MEILERLSAAHPTVGAYRHLLACCYRDMPAATAAASRTVPPTVDQAIHILQQLADDFPDIPEYRFDLSKTYAKLAVRVPPRDGEYPPQVEERLRQSLRLSQSLIAENPNVPEYVASHVNSLYWLSIVERHSAPPEDAEATLRKALTLQSALVEQFPEANSYVVWRTILQESLARLLTDRRRPLEAKTLLNTAITTLVPLSKATPQDFSLHELLGRCYKNLSDVLRNLGDDEQAEEMLRRGSEHRVDR